MRGPHALEDRLPSRANDHRLGGSRRSVPQVTLIFVVQNGIAMKLRITLGSILAVLIFVQRQHGQKLGATQKAIAGQLEEVLADLNSLSRPDRRKLVISPWPGSLLHYSTRLSAAAVIIVILWHSLRR